MAERGRMGWARRTTAGAAVALAAACSGAPPPPGIDAGPDAQVVNLSGQPDFYTTAVRRPNPVIFRRTSEATYEILMKAGLLDPESEESLRASAEPYVETVGDDVCGTAGVADWSEPVRYDARAYTVILRCGRTWVDPFDYLFD